MTGQHLSHYRIDEELGRGGMGIVYRAFDTRLERVVALKVLPEGTLASEEDRSRFVREARAAAKLHHPNIATVFDTGDAAPDGSDKSQPYIAMEFVAGQTLADSVADGPVGTEEATTIACQIAQALEAAHAEGVVHRDIKSGNVMITPSGQVKVLDFGLAKVNDDPAITKAGSTSGTMAYMSPEQARGESVDARADLWGLGVILYEMLSGQRPFTGPYESAVLYALLNEDPAELDDAPPSLNGLIRDLLNKDLEARPRDASEVLARLGASRADRPPAPSSISSGKWTIGAGVVAAAIVVVVAFSTLSPRGGSEDIRGVVLPRLDSLLSTFSRDTPSQATWEAFDLAQAAVAALPTDPYANALASRATGRLWVDSEHEGLETFIRRDSGGVPVWRRFGNTSGGAVPRQTHEVRFTAPDYLPREVLMRLADSTRTVASLDRVGAIPADLVRVSGGTQRLRMPFLDHLPAQAVPEFHMSRYEVTNAEFRAFVDAGGYSNTDLWHGSISDPGQSFVDETGRSGPAGWSLGRYADGEDDLPVRGVSWYEADAFARWTGRTLPSTYHFNAAAGFRQAAYLLQKANIDNSEGPMPVGASGAMSPPGAYDLAGNVREWVSNANARDGRRFILGGAWLDPPYMFQDAYTLDPMDRSNENGFRTVVLGPDASLALDAPIELPFRDYATEQPANDAQFAQYLRYFQSDPVPLEPEAISSDSSNADFVVERVSYHAGYGSDRMSAWVFVPSGSVPPYQAVVFFPGDWAFGVDRPVPQLPPGTGTWSHLPRDGRLLIIPVFRNQFDRGSELTVSTPNESVAYRDHMVMWSKEVGRSVDYLVSRGDVDPEAIALAAFSWGSRVSPVMIANEPRFKAAVLAVGGLRFQQSLPEVDPFQYLSRVTIPVLMLNGRYDFFFPHETSQIPFFEALGSPPEHKAIKVYETSHSLPQNEMVRESIMWLDRYLGPVSR